MAVGVDVLAYAQSLPTGQETTPQSNAGEGSDPAPKLGGPQGGLAGGMLAGLAAVFGMIGGSLLFLLGLLVLGMLVVWALRRQK